MNRIADRFVLAVLSAGASACGPSPAPSPQPQATPPAATMPASTRAPRAAAATTAATPAATGPAVAIDAEGLRLVDMESGRTRAIAFGTLRKDTLAALASHGAPQTGTNAECGAGPLEWATFADGLTLQFQDGAFVGWSIDRGSRGRITTMSGVGPGSTRAALESAYAITLPESTLGVEFAAGEMGGLLDGTGRSARITDMWAGTTCVFR